MPFWLFLEGNLIDRMLSITVVILNENLSWKDRKPSLLSAINIRWSFSFSFNLQKKQVIQNIPFFCQEILYLFLVLW